MSALFTGWTLLVGIVFLGVAAWAWSGRRKHDFEQAARIPLEDDADVERQADDEQASRKNDHG